MNTIRKLNLAAMQYLQQRKNAMAAQVAQQAIEACKVDNAVQKPINYQFQEFSQSEAELVEAFKIQTKAYLNLSELAASFNNFQKAAEFSGRSTEASSKAISLDLTNSEMHKNLGISIMKWLIAVASGNDPFCKGLRFNLKHNPSKLKPYLKEMEKSLKIASELQFIEKKEDPELKKAIQLLRAIEQKGGFYEALFNPEIIEQALYANERRDREKTDEWVKSIWDSLQ